MSTTHFIAKLKNIFGIGAAILMLSACGGGDQDRGKVSFFEQNFSGVAVDGHIARAKVFIDSNNNATRDPWEDFSFTDDAGYYGYNPNTGTDYCASDATPEEQQYCLSSQSALGNVVIRVDGGYDRLTGEPFVGQLSRRINALNPADRTQLVITPITTLLTSIQDPTNYENILAVLGIEEKDLDIDYLNSRGNNEIDSYLLNTALKIHKTITILSDRIDDTYTQMRETTGMPNDASQALYKNLANTLTLPNSQDISAISLDNILTNPNALLQILDNTEKTIRNTYNKYNIDLPLDMGSPDNPKKFNRPAKIAAQIPPLIDLLLTDVIDQGQILGYIRALEVVVIKSVNESIQDDSTINNAFDFFFNTGNTALIEALRIALSDDKADINALVANDFSGDDFNNIAAITHAARIQDDANAFRDLDGKQLLISDLDLGYLPNNLSDIELELYFKAGDSELSGSIIACAKYIDGASQNSLGEGNFKGEILNGFWSLLGATQEHPKSYSLLLTFDFLGANYQAIMKPAGSTTVNGIEYQKIRFDYDDEIKVWHSKVGLEAQQTIPINSQQCAQRLPSRIGI
ncbi:hypothetical protein [Marinagarivorans algicola]|uniref:hypothetical protein n=1 Tax=Marinagarivorans algicola TaxID=1513270 RepID=UPI0006B689CC|nr:hypothetical protein [Marinagarivorans algicola]